MHLDTKKLLKRRKELKYKNLISQFASRQEK